MTENTPAATTPLPRRRLAPAKRRRGLTLMELLVVAAVIAILAAIAYPFLQDALTRSKMAVCKNNQRVLASALEAYRADFNSWPPSRPIIPEDLFGILANYQLSVLTTPVAYAMAENFRDPFGAIQAQSTGGASDAGVGSSLAGDDRPVPALPNPEQSQFYFRYATFRAQTGNWALGNEGLSLVSLGPDSEDTFGAFYPFPNALPPFASFYGINSRFDTLYDPTNGTYSRGDAPRYVGVPGVAAQP
jgi:prepilin-type N-terminal cleavage/methylation domain-containing protein